MTQPDLSPLPPERLQLADRLAEGLDRDQALWLSGYFAGIAGGAAPAAAGAPASGKGPSLTVLFGTESGNSEALAAEARKAAEKRGFRVSVVDMAGADPAGLAKAERLLVIVSTWGEGDPPESAVSFYEAFLSDAMPQLANLKFSVCALGDTSYEQFCKIGRDFDERLASLGGERVHPRAECDVDYQATFDAWLAAALEALPVSTGKPAAAAAAAAGAPAPAAAVYDKKNPYPSEILDKLVLNGTGSKKEVLHVELSLEGSGLVYEPGDALGIYPDNSSRDIEAVLAATGLQANAKLEGKTLADALRTDFDITTLSPAVAMKYNGAAGHKGLAEWLAEDDKATLKEWIEGRQLIDLLEHFPHHNWSPESFTSILRKLNPRLYSIASSLKAHPDQVHLTIAAVRYHTHGRDRTGVCSCYVADDVDQGDKVRVFFHTNKNFRLPESDDTPVIMIGPGTGIAPFRAFVEERAARGAKGKNWLFFGDQHFTYDFLYQLEWLEYRDEGLLDDISLAFSRDQPHKIYVQHRIEERGEEIYRWLEEGAHFYVCGDASRMAKDVHQALIDLVAKHGGRSPEEAKAYVDALRKAKRYQRDVY